VLSGSCAWTTKLQNIKPNIQNNRHLITFNIFT